MKNYFKIEAVSSLCTSSQIRVAEPCVRSVGLIPVFMAAGGQRKVLAGETAIRLDFEGKL